MAARYAGDYFGISLGGTTGSDSQLLKYYPSLADTYKKTAGTETTKEDKSIYKAPKTPEAFGGFKAFEEPRGATRQSPKAFGGSRSFDVSY